MSHLHRVSRKRSVYRAEAKTMIMSMARAFSELALISGAHIMSACFSCLPPFPGTGAEACGTCFLATPLPLGRALQSSHGEFDDTVTFPWCSYAGWLQAGFILLLKSTASPSKHSPAIYLKSSWDFSGSPVAKTPHSKAGGLGSLPGQGTRSHMPQLRVRMLQLEVLQATAKGPMCFNQRSHLLQLKRSRMLQQR